MMRGLLFVAPLPIVATAAGQPRFVAVSVEPPTSVEIVLYAAGASGKVLATTERTGKGRFDASVLQNVGTLEMVEETCGERKRVPLIGSNGQMPQGAILQAIGRQGRRSIRLRSHIRSV